MDPTIIVAAVGALATIAAAVVAARTASNAEEVKRKSDDTRVAIDGFRELTAAHNEEIARLNAEIVTLRAELRAAREGTA